MFIINKKNSKISNYFESILFSTSVDLEPENVCMSVCVSQILWGNLETLKMVGFGWNFAHLFLGWISEESFSFFKILTFGPGDEFSPLNISGGPESSKLVGFGWKFGNFLGCISGSVFKFFKNFKVSLMFCYLMLQLGFR